MKERYLEVTFRKGKPLAAYLYLPRHPGAKSARTERHGLGVLVDYADSGEPIGLEITAPTRITLDGLNEVLKKLGLDEVAPEDIAPLQAA